MKSIIAIHKKILNLSTLEESKPLPCNCMNKSTCLLNGKCCEKSLIYKVSIVRPDNKTVEYYGCCETDFKARYYNHTHSFKNPSKRFQTEHPKLVWNLKQAGHTPAIKWSIGCKAKPYAGDGNRYQLCLSEKLAILQTDPDTLLNKRSELIAKCCYTNKFKTIKFVA